LKEFDPGESASIVISDRPGAAAGAQAWPVLSVHFLGDRALLCRHRRGPFRHCNGERRNLASHRPWWRHPCARPSDGDRIVMGGDDGKLVALSAKDEITLLAH